MYHERAPSIGWDSNHALGADRGPRQHCALGSEGGHLDHPNLGIHSKNHTTKRRDDGAAAGHRLLIDQHHQGVEDTNNSSNLADGLLEAGASLGGNDVAERRDVEEASTDPAVSLGKNRGLGRHVIVEEGSARVVLLQSKVNEGQVEVREAQGAKGRVNDGVDLERRGGIDGEVSSAPERERSLVLGSAIHE